MVIAGVALIVNVQIKLFVIKDSDESLVGKENTSNNDFM